MPRAKISPDKHRVFSISENKHITRLRKELEEYFEGKRGSFSLALIYPGSPFEVKVWNELPGIPYGATTSYEEIAKKIGSPKSSRAVGRANGFNRICTDIHGLCTCVFPPSFRLIRGFFLHCEGDIT